MCGRSCAASRQTSGCLLIRPAGREPLTGSPPGYPVAPSPCAPTLILWRVQWGHLSLEVVILQRRQTPNRHHSASMGPPLFRGGHLASGSVSTGPTSASMGPLLFRGGHVAGRGQGEWRLPASMGPPLFRGGHWCISASASVTTALQWGHLSLEVVIGPWMWMASRASSFNGAASL